MVVGGEEELHPLGTVCVHAAVPAFKAEVQKMSVWQQKQQTGTFTPISTASQAPRSCCLRPTHPRLLCPWGLSWETRPGVGNGSAATEHPKC